jgi:hypothetical protein
MQPYNIQEILHAISAYLVQVNSKINNRKHNHYWVKDICQCLRRSHYEITLTTRDDDSHLALEALWVIWSRPFLHNPTYAYRWRELDVRRRFQLIDENSTAFLEGRLDVFDYETGNIIDLKTSSAVKWQFAQRRIPRTDHIDQIQCYGTLFRDILNVSSLMLLYADMKNLIAFSIPVIDRRA